MKYLLAILFIVCGTTLVTLFIIWPEERPISDTAVVTINGRALTRQNILDHSHTLPHHGDEEEYIDEIITKQLLISEAQRRNIDKEQAFRSALKTFYEHSLIKVLMERVTNSIEVEITDEEVDTFLNSYGKTFTFYTLTLSGKTKPSAIRSEGKRYVSDFGALSWSLQQALADMQPGETVTTFVTGNEKIGIYLERVQGDPSHRQNFDKEMIRKQLEQIKIEKQVSIWIENLRKQASITYHEAQD